MTEEIQQDDSQEEPIDPAEAAQALLEEQRRARMDKLCRRSWIKTPYRTLSDLRSEVAAHANNKGHAIVGATLVGSSESGTWCAADHDLDVRYIYVDKKSKVDPSTLPTPHHEAEVIGDMPLYSNHSVDIGAFELSNLLSNLSRFDLMTHELLASSTILFDGPSKASKNILSESLIPLARLVFNAPAAIDGLLEEGRKLKDCHLESDHLFIKKTLQMAKYHLQLCYIERHAAFFPTQMNKLTEEECQIGSSSVDLLADVMEARRKNLLVEGGKNTLQRRNTRRMVEIMHQELLKDYTVWENKATGSVIQRELEAKKKNTKNEEACMMADLIARLV